MAQSNPMPVPEVGSKWRFRDCVLLDDPGIREFTIVEERSPEVPVGRSDTMYVVMYQAAEVPYYGCVTRSELKHRIALDEVQRVNTAPEAELERSAGVVAKYQEETDR